MSNYGADFAGAGGIEPSLAVLETAVLPLNDTPWLINYTQKALESHSEGDYT